MSHTREHEETLQECLAADDPQRALAGSASSGCAVCKDRVDELMDVAQSLDELKRDLRASRAHAGPVVGADLVGEVLGARLTARHRSRRLALASVVSAAAAVLLLGFFLVQRLTEPADTTLGPARLELSEPREQPERLDFTWSAELPAHGRYELRVLAADDARELARATTETPRWTSPPTTDWPRVILWRVDVLDASGTVTDSRERRFSFSR